MENLQSGKNPDKMFLEINSELQLPNQKQLYILVFVIVMKYSLAH